jgi:hypothetical protein
VDDWVPPSPEGLSHPDELINVHGRCTAALQFAFETQNRELFDESLKALQTAFAAVFDRWQEATTRSSE